MYLDKKKYIFKYKWEGPFRNYYIHSFNKYLKFNLFFYSTEASHPSKSGGCFTANSTVMSSDGSRLKLSELKIGDSVLSVNSVSGELEFSPIILFLDRDPNEVRQFFTIQTESGHSLTLTPTHLIYTSSGEYL